MTLNFLVIENSMLHGASAHGAGEDLRQKHVMADEYLHVCMVIDL